MKSDGSGSPIGPGKLILETTADGIKISFLISEESDEMSLRRKEIQGDDRCLENKTWRHTLGMWSMVAIVAGIGLNVMNNRLDDGLIERRIC